MPNNLYNTVYNPDVLSCIANLSSDEVFTPPTIANAMLDLLPQELFNDPNTTFLDPACKSGVFLREIAKRLLKGLEKQIPDLQERASHVFKKQIFGIAITELTSHLSRRSLYCSKTANGEYSVVDFDTEGGNVRFEAIEHTWENGKCKFCGASKGKYNRGDDLESHAYEFIHVVKPEEIFKMKFDVIISNPPYQLSDGGQAASAIPIYHKFVIQAQRLVPRYIAMIIPARWYVGGRGLDEFRYQMLRDKHIRELHDFPLSSDCFPGVEIKGGVCYFRWERDSEGRCKICNHIKERVYTGDRFLLEPGMDTFIRTSIEIGIVKKVLNVPHNSVSDRMNSGRHFGFHTQVSWNGSFGALQTADGASSYPISRAESKAFDVKVYIAHGECWIGRKDVKKNKGDIDKYKLLIPNVGNPGSTVLGRMKIGEPNSCHSNTYNLLVCKSKKEAENILSYFETKFVRFLVSVKTTTQHTPPKAFALVPLQDFSKPWTDEELYKKYKLTQEEIDFIESMIKPME